MSVPRKRKVLELQLSDSDSEAGVASEKQEHCRQESPLRCLTSTEIPLRSKEHPLNREDADEYSEPVATILSLTEPPTPLNLQLTASTSPSLSNSLPTSATLPSARQGLSQRASKENIQLTDGSSHTTQSSTLPSEQLPRRFFGGQLVLNRLPTTAGNSCGKWLTIS